MGFPLTTTSTVGSTGFMDDALLYTASCDPLDDVSVLAAEWLKLEAQSNRSFFLSWTWIGTWLEVFQPDCHVLRVYQGETLKALGLIVNSHFQHPYRFSSDRIHLHQKGNAICDQIWTEYNGLLCARENQSMVLSAAMKYLLNHYSGWDEFVIGAVTKKTADQLERASGLMRLDLWNTPTYGVNLSALDDSDDAYIKTLSKNTRHQIRRSFRQYAEETGELSIAFAQSTSEALQLLDETSPLHLKRWGNGISQSGFANDKFVLFHRRLIERAWDKGQIDVVKLTSGEKVLGYFYNFLYQGVAYFYLSGLVSESNSKLKPGLCGHSLLIQHYAQKGYEYYDFMGGDERYKASLGQKKDELFQLSLQKNRLHFSVENVLRLVKKKLGY